MGVSAIAAPPLTRLLISGLQRVGSLTFQRILRLRKVDAAIRADQSQGGAAALAIADYETVVGSYHGQLSQPFAEFLRELERTGIIELMVREAIARTPSEGTRAVFGELHRNYFSSEAGQRIGGTDAEMLYSRMVAAFGASILGAMNDKVLAEVLVELHADSVERIAKVELAVRKLDPLSALSVEELKTNVGRIAKALQSHFRVTRVETLKKGARNVDISRIYIPPTLKFAPTQSKTWSLKGY